MNCDIIQTPCNIKSLLCKVFVYTSRIHTHTYPASDAGSLAHPSAFCVRLWFLRSVFFSLNWSSHIVSMETEVRRSSQGMTLGRSIGPGVQGFQNGGLYVQ